MNTASPKKNNTAGRKNILCVMSDVGGAHRSAAEAMGEALQREYPPDSFTYEIVDLYQVAGGFCNFSIKSYPFFVNHYTWVYNRFFDFADHRPAWDFFYKVFIYPLMIGKVFPFIEAKKPDVILSTYALCNRLVLDALEELNIAHRVFKVMLVLDLFDVHRSWAERRADLTIVATDEAKRKILACGVPPGKVKQWGFPLKPRFQDDIQPQRVREKLGLRGDCFTMLIMGGGEGVHYTLNIVKELVENNLKTQLIVIAGRNAWLLNKLRGLQQRTHARMVVFGYTDKVHELMSVSDVVITKPGPTTLMEAMTKELPVIITGNPPRQELHNIDYVREKGIGHTLKKGEAFVPLLRKLIDSPDEIERLKANIRREKIPSCTGEVARLIMTHLQE